MEVFIIKKRMISIMCAAVLLASGCTSDVKSSSEPETAAEETLQSSGMITADVTSGTDDTADTVLPMPEVSTETENVDVSFEVPSSDTPLADTVETDLPSQTEPVPDEPTVDTDESEVPPQTTPVTDEPDTPPQTAPVPETPATSVTVPEENDPKPVVTSKTYEAEDAVLRGALTVSSNSAWSGGKAVENFANDSDQIVFSIDIPVSGAYDITFVSSGIGSYKENNAYIDGSHIGMFTSENEKLTSSVIPTVSLSKGNHELRITKSWGWIRLDCIRVEQSEGIDDEIYNVSDRLVNENADKRTKELFSYLCDCYGEYVLSGQVCDDGLYGREFTAIHDVTGKYPAILGLDMMDYAPSRTALGARSHAVDTAIEFGKKGGIVSFCWHWNAPTEYLKAGNDSDNGNPRWWGGFYTRNSTFDISAVMNGSDPEGKELIDRDIAEIAKQLKRLEKENIPVLWRPLHEASGGWFWWGAQGAEAFKKLWIYLYEQLTYEYQCNNLIWVFNGQNAEWYPGDEYVDIIGEDIYPGERVYSPQTARFVQATEYTDSNKIIALTENGCVFDIDQAVEANVKWAWFNTWCGDFVVNGNSYSEKFTEKHILQKVYDSEYVITLDELDW